VRSLADTQALLRRAVVTGEMTDLESLVFGGAAVNKRLAIHRRHYEASLVAALLRRFPATVWLVGSPFVTEAAQRFTRDRPPQAPCIAEYGAEFPEFLSRRPGAGRVPYLRAFSELEWLVGSVAVAIARPPLALDELATLAIGVLTNAVLILQPGVRYARARWPVDELMKLYLAEAAPDQFSLIAEDVRLEVRGARGEFRFSRLDAGEFIFREAVRQGRSIGEAAELALESEAGFDPGRTLTRLVGEGLATAIVRGATGIEP
jgi:hypothetical protein